MAVVDSWRTCLNSQKFVKKLAENNSKDSQRKLKNLAKNLFVVDDSDLFVWDSYCCHILYYNLKQLILTDKEKQEKFQTLSCTEAPRFEAEGVALNRTGTHILVWGQTGITAVELPQRQANIEGRRPCVTCKSVSIAEHYFASHHGVKLLTVLWHPGSETDSHVAFLTSDNTLCVYSIQEPDIPIQTVKLSNATQDITQSPNKVSIPAALGEYAASFDFGPPVHLKKRSRPGLELTVWPAYIVRGNGDVIVAYTDPVGGTKLPLQGPLIMQPPAEDNYGMDACAISCLDTTPSAIVIATSEGRLHHCLVMPGNDDQNMTLQSESVESEARNQSRMSSSTLYEPPVEASLFVYESVELEFSLATGADDPNDSSEDDFTCPIKILKDPLNTDRYHCLHSAGVHTVALPWIEEYYQQYFLSEDEPDIPTSMECTVEHLVCTKPLVSSAPAPVLGLAVVKEWQTGPALLTLTSDVEFISLPLRSRPLTTTVSGLDTMATTSIPSPLRKLPREPFNHVIAKILQKNFTNPLLKSNKKTEMSQQECYHLLGRTTQVFREEYLEKQDQAQQEIQRRVRILSDMKERQLDDFVYLTQLKQELQTKAGDLGAKCDDCQDKNEEILRRIEGVMRKLQARLPVLSEAERHMKKELENMHEQLDTLRNSLQQLNIKQKYQKRQIEKQKNDPTKSPALSDNQLKQIKDIMRKEGDDLNELMKKVNQLKLEAGV